MVAAENSKQAIKARQQARTIELAGNAAERHITNLWEVLSRHSDLLGTSLIGKVLGREYGTVMSTVIADRNEGRMYDVGNEVPGLTAYITAQGAVVLRQMLEDTIDQIATGDAAIRIEGYISTISPTDSSETAYSFRLENGTYSMLGDKCQFIGHKLLAGVQSDGVEDDAFQMLPEHIIRIEADSGEMWQNSGIPPAYIGIEP